MDDAADYRAKAEEAERLAETAPTSALREAFLDLARGWRDLVELANERQRIRTEILQAVARILAERR